METQEKLTLKELVGYLPYGLKVHSSSLKMIYDVDFTTINHIINHPKTSKIILRPLSDLTKEITHNGETFVPSKKLGWDYVNGNTEFGQVVYCEYGESPKTAVNVLDYLSDLEKLYEWHFDIHGLIEKGKAIDINTL